MNQPITCFKAYDIRGRVPDQLNEDVAYRVGCAIVNYLKAKKILVGHDIRLTSPSLANALMRGITDMGCDVLFIGQCGTEEVTLEFSTSRWTEVFVLRPATTRSTITG